MSTMLEKNQRLMLKTWAKSAAAKIDGEQYIDLVCNDEHSYLSKQYQEHVYIK